jgi:hypothetical protein
MMGMVCAALGVRLVQKFLQAPPLYAEPRIHVIVNPNIVSRLRESTGRMGGSLGARVPFGARAEKHP